MAKAFAGLIPPGSCIVNCSNGCNESTECLTLFLNNISDLFSTRLFHSCFVSIYHAPLLLSVWLLRTTRNLKILVQDNLDLSGSTVMDTYKRRSINQPTQPAFCKYHLTFSRTYLAKIYAILLSNYFLL